MAKKKITYAKLLDEMHPALLQVSGLKFPMTVPISHHVDIASNLEEMERVSKIFWDTRKSILESLCEMGEDEKPKTEEVDGQAQYVFSDENKVAWNFKFNELREEEVEVNLKKLDAKHFEGVEGISPAMIKGIFDFLKVK